MPYRYKFENTLEYINLSGCTITKAEKQPDSIALEFKYIAIRPEHPFSGSTHVQITDRAVLTFHNCSVSECLLFDKDSTRKAQPDLAFHEEFFITRLSPGFEIMIADSFIGEKPFSYQFFGIASKESGGYAAFTLAFDRVTAAWNKLFDDLWQVK